MLLPAVRTLELVGLPVAGRVPGQEQGEVPGQEQGEVPGGPGQEQGELPGQEQRAPKVEQSYRRKFT